MLNEISPRDFVRPGRPRLDSQHAATERLTVTITTATARWLRNRATNHGTSMATEVREILATHEATEED